MNKAFVLGAGLGERLRPLTDQLPKPLVPVLHRPLITYAFDHLAADLSVGSFVVNTFHLPEAYTQAFPDGLYQGRRVEFRKDTPVRLETAGGLANVRDLLDDGTTFIVYNGDILTDLPLQRLTRAHREGGHLVTLALRSSGPAMHIAFDGTSGRVTDIRNKLSTGNDGDSLFTGIYLVEPEFFDWLTPGQPESVIPIFLKLIEQGKLGGVIIDEGHWWDLGSRQAYLTAHQALLSPSNPFPRYTGVKANAPLHPTAQIAETAVLTGKNVLGPGSQIGAGAHVEDCILWPNATVAPGAVLKQCILRSNVTAEGSHIAQDF